ncbi:ferric reductase-like transmembrane domain-containing protein [Streptomyces sp. SPB162]|uniref:ferredoxin reductase family protein n=1 Tax=Streptomyces sp. SPB162 TaxID=2940560 RepID=UPI002405C1CA|nr:ferric reductase-like transmembrane domain-containing protein [Streptomyces sp. SPB162]
MLALAGAGAVAVLALWWHDTAAVVGPAGWLIGAGRIAGLLTGYGCAVLVALMARVPALERGVGSDRVARWHAMAGRYTICLLPAHIVLIVWGYAVQAHTGLVHETTTVVFDYPEMLKGTIAGLILLATGVLSARAVRRRVSYETWYYLHVLTYLALFLAFGHQLALGADFAGNAAAQNAWYVLYLGVAALVVWFRVLAPVRLNLRHRLRVAATVREAPGVVSVIIRGRRLAELHAEPGQFLRWRFLADGLWWTSTPYSLSAAPGPDQLRITVKALGDHSAALALLRPGTRVWAEGPYGALTSARRTRSKVLLLAGGVGVTPLRALFETLPARPGDLTLLYRGRTADDLALRAELEAIARSRGARLYYAVNAADGTRAAITTTGLRTILPDIGQHDVYLCGPDGMALESYDALRAAGVPAAHIHHESFEL